jgi:hypothetical protein
VPSADGSFTNCLSWDVLEPLLAYVDRYIHDVGDLILNPGYAKRLGAEEGQRSAALYKEAGLKGTLSSLFVEF